MWDVPLMLLLQPVCPMCPVLGDGTRGSKIICPVLGGVDGTVRKTITVMTLRYNVELLLLERVVKCLT